LVQNHHPSSRLPISQRSIRALVSRIIRHEKSKLCSLEVNFVDKFGIKKINKKFLNHNYYTDIITFPYNSYKNSLEGEIVISLDSVKKNAVSYGVTYSEELKRVIIHGCLHLAGYDDRTKSEKELIRCKENSYMGIK